MKIGIYGDSFGHAREREESAWYNLLDHDVTNFAHMGANVWYAYRTFLDNHNDFDLNIMFVTNWGRLNIPLLDQPHWPGIQQIDLALNSFDIDQRSKEILTSAHNYLFNVRNDQQEQDSHIALLAQLQQHDLLIIPCFPHDMSLAGDGFSMYDISLIDTVHYGIDKIDKNGKLLTSTWKPGERKELRACHMNNKNNLIFAHKINEWANGGEFTMERDDFVTPSEPLEFYFERRL